jgi:3-hydroxybutyryl-CoA dehydrogenase
VSRRSSPGVPPTSAQSTLGASVPSFDRKVGQMLVGVVGCGVMGSGILEVAARGGCEVIGLESDEAALDRARDRVGASLARADRGGLLAEPIEVVLGRISFSTDLSELATAEVVIEAIREAEEDKRQLFRQLEKVVSDDCLLATNTSSISVARIASATEHPGRVVGLHFFNPVPVLPLVEVVPSLLTDPASADRAEAFVRDVLGKTAIRAKDRAGFVVNVLLVPYLLSAVRLLDSGFATAPDIDDGMVGGCGMPMGPLKLMDLIGLDTMLLVAESLYAEFLSPEFAPPPLLRRMVAAGLHGRKSGRGFYDYASDPPPPIDLGL